MDQEKLLSRYGRVRKWRRDGPGNGDHTTMTLMKSIGVNGNDSFPLGPFLSALLFPTPSDSDSLSGHLASAQEHQ